MKKLLVCCGLFYFTGCEQHVGNNQKDVSTKIEVSDEQVSALPAREQVLQMNESSTEEVANYQTIEWTELIPESDLALLLNPPEYITDVVDGSFEDQIASTMHSAINGAINNDVIADDNNEYEQALISTNVIADMHGKYINIPGFVVPVDFDEEQVITRFFLVPYFGACLHMPPPPPNQIIYVETAQGFVLDSLYNPVIVSGQLSAELFEDQVATSAYTLQMKAIKMYLDSE